MSVMTDVEQWPTPLHPLRHAIKQVDVLAKATAENPNESLLAELRVLEKKMGLVLTLVSQRVAGQKRCGGSVGMCTRSGGRMAGHSASSSVGLSEIDWNVEKEVMTFEERESLKVRCLSGSKTTPLLRAKIRTVGTWMNRNTVRERETEDTSSFCLLP
jgi:hypothetical protein